MCVIIISCFPQAQELERLLSPSRDESQVALTAANAYVDIVNATQEALKIAEQAQQAAQNATDMVSLHNRFSVHFSDKVL